MNIYNGDPVWLQHLAWLLGKPSTWLTILIWVLIAGGFIKAGRRLWQRPNRFWFVLFVFGFVAALLGYLAFTVWAHHMFTVGMAAHLIPIIRVVKFTIVLFGIASAIWIIWDWQEARRAN